MMASLPYGWLLAGAMLFALSAGWRASIVSAIVAAGWLLFDAAWGANSPAALIAKVGISISYIDVWALTDLIIGLTALKVARGERWGWAIWLISAAMIGMHMCHELGMAFQPYKVVLDTLFLAQLLVLYKVGGQHVGRHLSAGIAYVRHVLGREGAAQRQKGARA